MPAALRLTEIVKTFGGVRALRGVSFEVLAGEVHALVGENGAGKSTLVKVVTGAHAPDSGTIEIGGREVAGLDPARARRLGVAAIYQHPTLFPDLSVEENIAFGWERCGPLRLVRWHLRRERARRLLADLGAEIDPGVEARRLGWAQQQLVEIARALAAEARLLIMDEPTASLGPADAARLSAIVRNLCDRGVGIIYITHRLEELPRVADRVTVLRDGDVVGTRPAASVTRDELIRLMIGRDVDAVLPRTSVPLRGAILETRGLGCRALRLRGIDLQVQAGEVVGLAGLVGSGRTELARVLFGLDAADSGTILVRGRPVALDSPGAAIGCGIALVPEDRRRHGVIPELSVAANVTAATLDRVSSRGFLWRSAECAVAERAVSRLAIKAASVGAPVGTLSGGNQQKVALARWLEARPTLLILDEPTQGVDVGAKAEIHRLIGALAADGMAILLISSDMAEVLALSDRVAVMRGGTIAGALGRAAATPESVMALALPEHKGAAA